MTPQELLFQAEHEILASYAAHLKAGSVETATWKMQRLREFGKFTAKAEAIIQKYEQAILAGTGSAVEEAAMQSLIRGEQIFKMAQAKGATSSVAIPLDADPTIVTTIGAWQTSAKNQMNLAMATMLEKAGQVYVDTINTVTAEVMVGASTGREALIKAVRRWSENGIPSIVDKAGRQWTTEAYANMVIRSNTRRVTTEVQMARAKEYGCDLVEISAHAGARPLCAPYQGKIFSLSGKDPKYPPFSSTSYGEPAGLFGINCGHMQYPYFPGISEQTYHPIGDEEQNAEVYAESQRQRLLERTIRARRREVATLEALGPLGKDEAQIAKAKLRDAQGALADFIKDTGRTRRPAREQVYDLKPPTRKSPPAAPKPAAPKPAPKPAPGKQPELPPAAPPPAPKPAPAPAPAPAPKPVPVPQPAPPPAPPAAPQREKFVPAATRAEAEKWAKDHDLADLVDFGKLNIDACNAINEGLWRTYEIMPRLRDQMKMVGSSQGLRDKYIEDRKKYFISRGYDPSGAKVRAEMAANTDFSRPGSTTLAVSYSISDKFTGIGFNENFYKDMAITQRKLDYSVSSKFHPPGCNTIKSIMDHELGHRIDKILDRISSKDWFMAAATDKRCTYGLWDRRSSPSKAKAWKAFLTDKLSEYAATKYSHPSMDNAEFLAEAWAEYQNNPNPRPIANMVAEILIDKYQEKFGGPK